MKTPSHDILEQLAERAAAKRRLDKLNSRKLLKMKEYFRNVLLEAGFKGWEIQREWLVEMGKITGARGGKKTAELVRSGAIVPQPRTVKSPAEPRTIRFNEFLFPDLRVRV